MPAEHTAAPGSLANGMLAARQLQPRPLAMADLREAIWQEVTDWQAAAGTQALGFEMAPLEPLGTGKTASSQAVRPLPLSSLLALDGALFIVAAYQTLLGRLPDQTGFTIFSSELAKGRTKLSILRCLQTSAEAQSCGRRLRGLQRRYLAQRLGSRWSRALAPAKQPEPPAVSESVTRGLAHCIDPAAIELWPARVEQRLAGQQAALQMITARLDALHAVQRELAGKIAAVLADGAGPGRAAAQQCDWAAATAAVSDELRALSHQVAALEHHGVAALQGDSARPS